ncbi:hypothetical protein Presley_24 [Acinetobacter phage Presley]|uniref:Uncharacterized protein n=1 Tax=Acinetobacter phage Presley TaxID=1406780 RepID=U5PWG9_9CAUD|nr:hypothetical protein Presley_24 [Acinetobacter phage Presley]AGY48091.1 hypothetical protein Presley_24 [Acinetobacter phage Presley]
MAKTILQGLLIVRDKNLFEIWKMITDLDLPHQLQKTALMHFGRVNLNPNDPTKITCAFRFNEEMGTALRIPIEHVDVDRYIENIPDCSETTHRNGTKVITIKITHWDQIRAREKLLGLKKDDDNDISWSIPT